MRDYYLTLSSAQTVLSTGSSSLNTPFDTGNQVSSAYGRSPYQSSSLLTVKPRIGQAVKKFFFQVSINSGMSGGTAGTTLVIALQHNATSGATGWVSAYTSASIPKPYLTAAAEALLVKIPLPDQINTVAGGMALRRYLKALYTVALNATALTKLKIDTFLDVY